VRGSVVQINRSPGGLPKRPVPEALATSLGLEGDSVAHPHIHGGLRKALLLIASETIDALIARGFPLFYGALGENLTTRGLDWRQIRPGQRFRAGEAFIEITKVRQPCSSLDIYGPGIQNQIYDQAVKAGDPTSPVWGMSGFYAAVVQPGRIRTNDIIWLVDATV
jgi:MOSC domain-containing protein YiiM